MSGARSRILHQQREWALATGLRPDAKGYLPNVRANLCGPLSRETRRELVRGSGSELRDRNGRPAKMGFAFLCRTCLQCL